MPEKPRTLQVLKITRNTNSCIDCGKCSRACPQGIDVASLESVTHSDCNLCGDCISSCPVKNTLNMNKHNNFRWVPVIALFVLVLTGLYFGNKVEIPTVNIKWAKPDIIENSAEFEMSGLKNIKCYGSSMSFVNQMKTVPGILGAATFVNSHTVKLWYDSTAITPEQIKKRLFNPVRVQVMNPEDSVKIAILDAGIYNFFDQMDVFYLEKLMASSKKVFAFETHYGEPVSTRFYCDYSMNQDSLKKLIEQKILVFESNGLNYNIDLAFKANNVVRTKEYVYGIELKRSMFNGFKKSFNNYDKYTTEQLGILEAEITDFPINKNMFPYLINYLGKTNKHIVGLNAFYDTIPKVRIIFANDSTDFNTVFNQLCSEKITVVYTNGIKEEMDNPYKFR